MGLRPVRWGGRGTLDRLTDEDLVVRMCLPDPRAFEVLYRRHATAVFSLAYRMMGTTAAAEDVTQEAFLSAWRAGGRYDPARGSVRTWLLGLVHHRAIDALRRRNPRERREIGGERLVERVEASDCPDAEVADRQAAHALRRLVADLPAEQRQVVELAYFRGLTHAEIAALVDAPLGTIKGRMRLALEKLRAAAHGLEAGR
jgi:RNA polymerase sigma-70 factor (ECF subfamily)